jgi:hypothetical protein
VQSAEENPTSARRPADDQQLRRWLENMRWHHRFSTDEIAAATGLTGGEIEAALDRFDIRLETKPIRADDAPLLVLPYPGGRHPRIGFLDGAVDPQRETKISVFTPWDDAHYVVVDVPEAIWWTPGERELLYLAHTHIPTTWTKQQIELKPAEWRTDESGVLRVERTLPNGVAFGAIIQAQSDAVLMELWLRNGADQTLTGLDVQNCVMLKGAPLFAAITNDNKVFSEPYAACRDASGQRWVITAWRPCDRVWGNEQCPCLHSDPKFPDCDPHATVRLRGWLSFYEGEDIDAEIRRIDQTAWWTPYGDD